MIRELTSTVANWISLSRLALVIPMWVWALQGRFGWVGWALIYTGISDVLDGLAARIFDQCSEVGEKIDSWTDHLVLISSALWLVLFRRDLFPAGQLIWIIPPAVLYGINLAIGLIKHHRFAAAHLLEAKLMPVMAYIVIVLAMFGVYNQLVYMIMIASWVLNSVVNITFHYRPDLFNRHQRSLILGLLGLDFEQGLIRYFFS